MQIHRGQSYTRFSRSVDHIVQTNIHEHVHIVDQHRQLHERLEVCGSAVRVRMFDLGYVSENIALVRVLHEKVLGNPFPAATTHIGKMFWTRVWVESLDMVPFGYSRPVYIGLHRVVSSISLNVVASLAMVAFWFFSTSIYRSTCNRLADTFRRGGIIVATVR